MIESVFKALSAGLSIWEHKAKNKYAKKLMSLKRDYYEEFNKEMSDHAILDDIEFQLQLLCEGFNSQVGTKDSLSKS